MIIFDTDILSIFAKIDRLELIKKLFGTIYICPMIKEEFIVTLEYGYKFSLDILNNTTVIIPTEKELSAYTELRMKVGKGEAEAISIAKSRKLSFATNDKVAQKVAKENGVGIISLLAILKALLEKRILSQDELIQVIKDIRLKDNLIIPDDEIGKILTENR